MVTGTPIGLIITTIILTIGTRFGGYLPVRAGPGKLSGTGDTVTTGQQAVLLSPLDRERRHRYCVPVCLTLVLRFYIHT